jgi:3-dehydroquinate dehydratase type I
MKLGKAELPTPALCGCITGSDSKEMLKGMKKARKLGADCVELRIDWMEKKEGWEELVLWDFPKILTNRPTREGGKFEGSEEERVKILVRGIELGVNAVDVEASTPRPLLLGVLKKAKEKGVSTILSFHDFNKTPSLVQLQKKIRELSKMSATYLKIVTMAKNPHDSIRILDLLVSNRDVPLITFCMGEEGKVSRIGAALLGCPLVYTSVENQTAPGQLDLRVMREILLKLGIRK